MCRSRFPASFAPALIASLACVLASLCAGAAESPPELALSTYLGGPSDDVVFGVAFDAEGNVYVAGGTVNPPVSAFPLAFPADNAMDGGNGRGGTDVLVTKLSPDGEVVYSAILGGPGFDEALAIAVDAAGRAHVTGIAGPDFPLVDPIEGYQAGSEAFVAVLDPSGTALLFSSYLSGANSEAGTDLAVDAHGDVYVCGTTDSDQNTFIPTTPTFDNSWNGGVDGFLAKIDYLHANAPEIVYKTFMGTPGYDAPAALALGADGSVAVGGVTSGDVPFDHAPSPLVQTMPGGFHDAFLLRVNSVGRGATFFTWLGGESFDYLTDLTLTPEGEIWATGHSYSEFFPTTGDAILDYQDNSDLNGWFARLDAAGSDLRYSSYWGGFMYDLPNAIVVADDTVIVAGYSDSADLRTRNELQPFKNGFRDAFFSQFSADGRELLVSSFLGGDDDEYLSGAAWHDGRLALAGSTLSQGANGFPTTPGAPQRSAPFPLNGFVTSIAFETGTPDLTIEKSDGDAAAMAGGAISYELAYANGGTRDAAGVVLSETVPEHTVFAPGSSSAGWDCQPDLAAGSTCTLDVGPLAVSADGVATFAVRVDDPLPEGVTEIVNTASIEDDGSHGDDPTPADNEASETTPVAPKPPACQLTVLAPAAGDSLVRGRKTTLRWAASGECGAAARLELVEPDGDVLLIAAAADHLPDPFLSWPVFETLALGPGYRLRVSAGDAVAESGEVGVVASRDCKLVVVRPNGGETARRGRTFEIAWTRAGSTCGQLADLQLLQAGKVKATLTPLTANDGAFTWEVPSDFPKGRYKARVRDLSNRAVLDVSNTTFRVR